MSAAANLVLHRRFHEEAWNAGDLAVVDELCGPDLVFRFRGTAERIGPEGMKAIIVEWRTAFPDFVFTIEAEVADEERVAGALTFRGTHLGVLWGVPPTGRSIVVTQTGVVRAAGGKIVEMWEDYDELLLLQQLGLAPSTADLLAAARAAPA
jgi:steroid delta-isomerase-like uncharacterized protein